MRSLKGGAVSSHPTIPLPDYREYPVDEMRQRLEAFYAEVSRRRTVREFSDRPVPRDIIETALKAANTAPSGANLQPWYFVVVSAAATKKKIRSGWLAYAQDRKQEDSGYSVASFRRDIQMANLTQSVLHADEDKQLQPGVELPALETRACPWLERLCVRSGRLYH